MTRTYSTITWGLALLLAAAVLAWQQSLPWTLATVGAVTTIAGLAKAITEETAHAKQAQQARQSKPSTLRDQT